MWLFFQLSAHTVESDAFYPNTATACAGNVPDSSPFICKWWIILFANSQGVRCVFKCDMSHHILQWAFKPFLVGRRFNSFWTWLLDVFERQFPIYLPKTIQHSIAFISSVSCNVSYTLESHAMQRSLARATMLNKATRPKTKIHCMLMIFSDCFRCFTSACVFSFVFRVRASNRIEWMLWQNKDHWCWSCCYFFSIV